MLGRLWSHRALLSSLVRRQYQLRYRQSLVGFAWALLPPLATLGVGVVLFHEIAGLGGGEGSYEVATMAGLVPWTFFANSLTQGVPSVVGGMQMVTRLAFPRAVLPLSFVGLSLLDLLVAGAAFVVVAFVAGEGLPASALFAPVLLLVEIPLIAGIVLLGSAMNVFARDIRLAVPFLVQFWLLLTPVLYPLDEVIRRQPSLEPIFVLNPMTFIVESFRDVLVEGHLPSIEVIGPAIAASAVVFVLGLWYFSSTEPRFADVV